MQSEDTDATNITLEDGLLPPPSPQRWDIDNDDSDWEIILDRGETGGGSSTHDHPCAASLASEADGRGIRLDAVHPMFVAQVLSMADILEMHVLENEPSSAGPSTPTVRTGASASARGGGGGNLSLF
jgi:hypothetical protein